MIPAVVDGRSCTRCDQHLPWEDFGKNPGTKSGRNSWCRECHKAYLRERGYRQARLRLKYGITVDDYDRMWSDQGGKCAICSGLGGERNLSVDHDHATGKVRALLCHHCNTGIGNLKDDPELLTEAIAYLRRFAEGSY